MDALPSIVDPPVNKVVLGEVKKERPGQGGHFRGRFLENIARLILAQWNMNFFDFSPDNFGRFLFNELS